MGKKLTQEEIIKRFIQVHGNDYDYSDFIYNGYNKKGAIKCNKCGYVFEQTPNNHIQGKGCPKCGIINRTLKRRLKVDDFELKVNVIHKNKYIYFQDYVNEHTLIKVLCQKHGEFMIRPDAHLQGQGCRKCGYESNSKTSNYFENLANKKHNLKYIYHQDYVKCKEKVRITCPIHGDFFMTPNEHLRGSGCPHCKSSQIENDIKALLSEHKIEFYYNKYYKWLNRLQLDFYLPEYNIAIECQGIQHFEPRNYFGGENEFNKIIIRDNNKKMLCNIHNVKLLYYANYKYNFPYEVITDKNKLLEEILKNGTKN